MDRVILWPLRTDGNTLNRTATIGFPVLLQGAVVPAATVTLPSDTGQWQIHRFELKPRAEETA